jgi:Spy/CpxP family protein refolding chaperone
VKRNGLLYLVIFSLALNFGTIGTIAYHWYQERERSPAPGLPPPMPMRDLWKTLKLDEAQRQAVHRLVPEHRAKVARLRQALFQKRQELFELLQGETPDRAVVTAKVGEISALQGQLEEELARHLLEFRKFLKPEQTSAFLNLMRSRMDKAMGGPCGPLGGRGPRRGPGMGPGPPAPPPGMRPGHEGPGRPD